MMTSSSRQGHVTTRSEPNSKENPGYRDLGKKEKKKTKNPPWKVRNQMTSRHVDNGDFCENHVKVSSVSFFRITSSTGSKIVPKKEKKNE